MNKQRTIRTFGAATLFAIGPMLYAKSDFANVGDNLEPGLEALCQNELPWGTSASVSCKGGKMTAGTGVSTTGHKQLVVNFDKAPPGQCQNGGVSDAWVFGRKANGGVVCAAVDATADGTSVANTGDGTCDAASSFLFALVCDNPCDGGCIFNGDECLCGVF